VGLFEPLEREPVDDEPLDEPDPEPGLPDEDAAGVFSPDPVFDDLGRSAPDAPAPDVSEPDFPGPDFSEPGFSELDVSEPVSEPDFSDDPEPSGDEEPLADARESLR